MRGALTRNHREKHSWCRGISEASRVPQKDSSERRDARPTSTWPDIQRHTVGVSGEEKKVFSLGTGDKETNEWTGQRDGRFTRLSSLIRHGVYVSLRSAIMTRQTDKVNEIQTVGRQCVRKQAAVHKPSRTERLARWTKSTGSRRSSSEKP